LINTPIIILCIIDFVCEKTRGRKQTRDSNELFEGAWGICPPWRVNPLTLYVYPFYYLLDYSKTFVRTANVSGGEALDRIFRHGSLNYRPKPIDLPALSRIRRHGANMLDGQICRFLVEIGLEFAAVGRSYTKNKSSVVQCLDQPNVCDRHFHDRQGLPMVAESYCIIDECNHLAAGPLK
jgi:hypothetical protein